MRTDAIVLGFLTMLLGSSLSVRAQAPLQLPDLSEPEPTTQDTEAPAVDRTNPTEEDSDREDQQEDQREDQREEDSTNSETNSEMDETDSETESETESETNDENPENPGSDTESLQDEDGETSDTALPPLPQGCEALPLVNGEGNEVTKRTSPPSFTIPIPLPGPIPDPHVQSNWNTDWYIPNAQEFQHYRVVLMPRSNGRYSIQMFFKYPDETSEQFYEDQEIRLTANEPLIIEAEPRSDLSPYQINANIGGILSIGVRYTILVAGCREG